MPPLPLLPLLPLLPPLLLLCAAPRGADASPAACPAGRFANASLSDSLSDGSSADNLTADGCSDCPSGYHNALPNRTSCSVCSRGKFGTPSVSLGGGLRTSMGVACTVCPEGTYNDEQHQRACKACPRGRFNYIDADQPS